MRKLLIPEVVQTSSLDCGPASLKALLEGFGQHVSYGRLREACQTGLDGTSIETIETVAQQLGLEAEQIMLPLNHLLAPQANALPAIVVTTLPQGITHFVVVWRQIGSWLQIMDPCVGRRWVHKQRFLCDVYQHTMLVTASDWMQYASSDDFQSVFKARQRAIGVKLGSCDFRYWQGLAVQDAALRLTQSLVDAAGISRGRDSQELCDGFISQPKLIPANYFSVTDGGLDAAGNQQVLMRECVLVRVKRKRSEIKQELEDELAAALHENPVNPMRELGRLVLGCGHLLWPILIISLFAAAACTFLEALLFRGLLDFSGTLALTGQRMGAAAAVILFSCALLLLELPAFVTGARLGRILESRLRAAFLEKLPKLSDRYFQSRPISDMAERSHILHRLRHLPDQLRQLVVAAVQLAITAAGVVWLEPRAWPFMLGSLAAALIPLFSSHWLLAERDLRVRTHSGGLMRFYLDAMLGLVPIRTHGAAYSLRRKHSLLLGEWAAASLRLQRAVVWVEGLQLSIMFGLVAALLLVHPFSGVGAGRVLLLAYWALNMPALGQEIATLARQYPRYRNVALRLLEPLGSSEEQVARGVAPLLAAPSIEFRNVCVVSAGTSLLEDISVSLEAGEQVAIVGPSGAGKSTLVGLLLGWLKPSSGDILVNGKLLNTEQVRLSTAWVDPAIQLWNRSLLSNLGYGGDTPSDISAVIDTAELPNVLEMLPQGLQTILGENGGLVSGGEGQRVRFARALQRRDAKLVILDEPFRGLDRPKRSDLLARARQYWSGSTLLCATHDLSETQTFDRVLVIERGALIENGSPLDLAANSRSRYSQLLAAEEQARTRFWESEDWRRIRLHAGRIVEEIPRSVNVEACESEVA